MARGIVDKESRIVPVRVMSSSIDILALSHRERPGVGPRSVSQSTAPPKSSTALTSRVATILSTSYSDAEFRDALVLLDERGVINDPETRRQLRLDLQKEVIDSNSSVVAEFGKIAEHLQRIKATLDRLNSGYQDVKKQIETAHVQTAPALGEAASLLEQRKQVEDKQRFLDAFNNHFTMSEDEVAALTMTAEPVDDRFFNALLKAKKISKDCEVLLGFENQTLGLELMEETSKQLNLGFQKLYKWLQREFKTLNLENPQMNPSVRHALRVLTEKPALFQNCLDFFAEARERVLTDSFYTALTGTSMTGVPDRSAKPIDMTAHDPLRYVGDMLAWIHSASVSEREALEVLFVAEGEELTQGLRSGRDAEIWRLVADDDDQATDFNALRALHELVDRVISGAGRLLRQRIEQVIQTNEDIITAYKLANLVNFYSVTFEKLLGSESSLVGSTKSLQSESMRQFRALVREYIATLQGEFQQTPSDLGPPGFLQESLKQLQTFIQSYESSLSVDEDREAGFESILAETFDPFMSGCDNMARAMTAPNNSIFLINCALSSAACLGDFEFTRTRSREIQDSLDKESKNLVAYQHRLFRQTSGLGSILEAVGEGGSSLKEHLQPEILAMASRSLDNFLPSALMDAMDRLKHLQDSSLARRVTEEAAELFCQDFERIEDAIQSAHQEGTGDLKVAFPRTTVEIRVLLS